jgi:WS/DGAT/MGAT family acyltransferase
MTAEISGLRRRLSLQDSVFYYLETDQAPMTMGSIAVFDGYVPFRRFVENIESKLHQIPRYMQKVVETPFNFTRPTWEFDPNFDIRRHINRVTLPSPGTDRQLTELAERMFRGRLDRSKPLWEMQFVEGLEGGRTGVISRIHHCLVDGVGGVEGRSSLLGGAPHFAVETTCARNASRAGERRRGWTISQILAGSSIRSRAFGCRSSPPSMAGVSVVDSNLRSVATSALPRPRLDLSARALTLG